VNYTASDAKAWAREKLVGQWTTMVTPFTPDDQLDERGLASNIEHVLRLGTKGMGFSWNMGEFWSLTRDERLRLMEVVPALVRGRALTAFQITETSLKEVVQMGERARELGYDFVILAPPYIMTKTEEQVLDFVKRAASQISLGIAFYNSPQFGITLSAKALARLADLKNLIAIKEASFNMQLSIDTHLQAGEKAVVSAPDEEIFFFEEFYGFHQQVMFANTSDWRFDTEDSHHYVHFIDLATKGRLAEAKRLYFPDVWPIKSLSRRWWARLATRTGGGLPVQMVKYWGELMGMKGGHVRPPVLPLTEEERTELRQELSRLRPLKVPEIPARAA
jgi:4-hydroxy-tetrahydrodipicolinate synthase